MLKALNIILWTINNLINAALKLDPESLDNLARHAGKTLAVNLSGINQTLYMYITVDGVKLSFQTDNEPTTTLIGTPLAFLRLLSKDQPSTLSDIKLNGSPHFAQDIQKIFKGLSIDWEEQLSKFIGDTAAFQVGKAGKSVGEWADTSRQNFYQNASAFLQQETAQLPSRAAVHDFLADVDKIRNDVERIAVRIKHLTRE